jgi:hypothetical protein
LDSLDKEPLLAIIHAYFDESGKKSDHPVVAFSGVCVGRDKLDDFDIAWRTLLRQYDLPALHMAKVSRSSQKVGSKMKANQTWAERIDCLKPFADCINAHLEIGLIQAWDVKGFWAIGKAERKALGSPTDPYYTAFARALIELVDHVKDDDRISLICDDDRETALDCYRHYRGLQHARPDIRKKFASLTFATDDDFPALQAADMVAYLSRLEANISSMEIDIISSHCLTI